ncbi:hypothetical protein ACEPAF_3089 [Sanghuangporus sanghuang]
MNLILDRSESSFEMGQSVLLNLRDRVAALHLFLSSHRYDLRANTAYPQKSIPGIALRVHTRATCRCEGGASPQLPELAGIDGQVLVECQCTQ